MRPKGLPPRIKHPYVGGVDRAFFRWMDIPDKNHHNRVYLRRLIVFKLKTCALYIHWLYLPDSDKDPHNHPMNFWSWVIRGGYAERRRYGEYDGYYRELPFRVRTLGSLARTKKKGEYHKIISLFKVPTITVLFCGRRSDSWGFLTEEGHVDYRTYLGA